jgi:hypothetical protein
MTRLGTLHMLVNPLARRIWKLSLAATSRAAPSNEWGLDYLVACVVTQRACSPSGKPLNESYPAFITNVAPTVKTIASNLSGTIAKAPIELSGKITSGSQTVTALSPPTELEPGLEVTGSGIPPGTTITVVSSTTVITLSAKATKSETTTLTFSKYGHPDHGLGGQLMELPAGETTMVIKLSSLVPDEEGASLFSEQLGHSAKVVVTVTPRWQLIRTA